MEAMPWLEVTGGSHAMSKRRVTCLGTAAFLFLLCACSAASAQLFTPEQTLIRVHAYEGSPRPAKQIATVFARPYESTGLVTHICKVDGKSLFRLGWSSTCPSVVYLLSGTHQLTIEYRDGRSGVSPTIPIRVEAGKTYMVLGTTSQEGFRVRVATSVSAMSEGFVLTYKDIVPAYYAKGDKPNSRINPEDAK
jgi:hypothetical protein